ncbi:hypothetical protein SH1V18_41570 [Vallitalea longa]|uniref:Lipoprotein n=1 Tax=Vallitalea longa TaxID=2936439 RepID=A0A9W5YDU8_9FIRM|nr:hypothetical protein [Vallitalea longa]GKX31677.1 hypothetical protein SH1V18_41570 [Vallitalea longa]
MKYIKMSIFFMTLIVTTGCSKNVVDVQKDTYKRLEILPDDTYDVLNIKDNISLAYGESKSIYVKIDNDYIEICKTLCSFPEIAPNESAIAYVTGNADTPGELYIYRFKSNEKTVLLDNNEGKEIPLDAVWLDNETLILIRSKENEKLESSTEVCVFDVNTKEATPILTTNNLSCYKSITKNGDMYEFELVTWDDETSAYIDSEILIYNESELKKIIHEQLKINC